MSQPRFEIRKTRTRLGRTRWHVVLVGANGEPLSSSESLNSREAALGNVDAQVGAFYVDGGTIVVELS